ncbi:Hypothetical predicted protein [Lynx pardinus]|uniref:Uncharacterized protein n=1 Tax=Lynx pardinus TaxID=191816 RepID=A0A485PUG7_LYNPA|nr:Hypothetical predicted protein [Lynx pardinus]
MPELANFSDEIANSDNNNNKATIGGQVTYSPRWIPAFSRAGKSSDRPTD